MSKKLFTDNEVKLLSENKYVKNVTNKAITYTDEFKIIFIAERSKGKLPIHIFEDAGFDTEVLGGNRIWCASKRWRNRYNESGELGLMDSRKVNSGRSLKRELTVNEIIAKKDAEIAYWKAEAELLKKLELQEMQVKNSKLSSISIFKIIQNIISKYSYKNMITHLCKIAEVSRSGYYTYLNSSKYRKFKEDNDLELKDIIVKAFNDYMDYYNNYRYQWGLKKLAPIQYRDQLLAA